MDINSLRERSDGSLTVSELNNMVRAVIENTRAFSSITVKGEISNFTDHRSGHLYFSLKDADSQIKAVMFRSSRDRLKFKPEDGMKVVVRGSLGVFTRDGAYQLYVTAIEPDGLGALYLAYEQLKEKLAAEGLFDRERKKPIPKYPNAIGVITSPTGAAVRDIINVIGRRYPLAKIYLYPSLVQGALAEDSLCRALEYFNQSGLVDTVIIGRGGGSIEDLWAFNSEKLARLIYSCGVPVISAVGHETDYTICDFVADLRAPTPSAAAELAVPDRQELMMRVDSIDSRLSSLLQAKVSSAASKLTLLSQADVIKKPDALFRNKRDILEELNRALSLTIQDLIKERRNKATFIYGKLDALSPLSVLSRGYSVAELGGKVLLSVKDVGPNDAVRVRLKDGSFFASVTAINEGEINEKRD